MPMRISKGLVDPHVLPALPQLAHALLHGHGHPDALHRILARPQGMGVAEEDDDGVADELVQGRAVFGGNLRHLLEVTVEEKGNFFGLPLRRRSGEVLDVRKKHRQAFALGLDFGLAGAVKQRLVDLRRQVARQLLGQGFQALGIGAALQVEPHARQQHGRADGLGDVVGGAQVQPELLFFHAGKRGQKDDRDVGRARVSRQRRMTS
jgi:hypothetical protein